MPLVHLRNPYLGINLTNHINFYTAGALTIQTDGPVPKHLTSKDTACKGYADLCRLTDIAMYKKFVT